MEQGIKIPESHKGPSPRCPLCFAQFAREEMPLRRQHILKMIREANTKYQIAKDTKDELKIKLIRDWGEKLEESLKADAAEAFLCHFCKIAVSCNDPFVGKWEEAYSKGEKIFCPNCEHEMRFFCTSTGYMQAKCPVKKCQAKWESAEPDRRPEDREFHTILDEHGNKTVLPGVDRPIASPTDLSASQIGQAADNPNLPKEVFIPILKKGKA
jgi:hypothetical protein